ncbi:MAG: type 1 glutamine amidotransferase [Sphingobacteriales bacterium]|nr:MAG: type 1 glutamine amidotransferase [Sphingobacteriales bacterium]
MISLDNKKVAILTDNGFEEIELTSPKRALEQAGAVVDIVSLQKEKVKGWDHDHWSIELPVTVHLSEASAEDYDALLIPGGVINPDKMRGQKEYVAFAQHFLETGKPLAAICHGPQLLIETGMLGGREMTSYPSIQTDIKNAGASWHDKEVVVDNGLVTSRSPRDLDAFNSKMIEEIAEGRHMITGAFTHHSETE